MPVFMRDSYGEAKMSIKMKISVALATALACAISVQTASATGPAQGARQYYWFAERNLPIGDYTLAPFAYVRFCAVNPEDCRGGTEKRVSWNAAMRGLVSRVNRQVNRSIRPVNDVDDSWNIATSEGDCEDFALTKQLALINEGLPSAAVRIATAITARGVGHAVLVISTSAGDVVLDNRMDSIKLWYQTDLSFIKIASAENPRIWQSVAMR
jgi:predicted transglutaminase-like cysteine proteinase